MTQGRYGQMSQAVVPPQLSCQVAKRGRKSAAGIQGWIVTSVVIQDGFWEEVAFALYSNCWWLVHPQQEG